MKSAVDTFGSSLVRHGNVLAWVILILVPLAVYGPVVDYEFVGWDDDVNILNNPHVATLGWAQLQWMFTDVERAHRYLPLGWLSYAVQLTLWGRDAFMFHVVNLALHVVNGLLIYGLIRRVLAGRAGLSGREGRVSGRLQAAALAGALVWALNPLRVEVVSWCSSRIYLMATLWFLLSLHAYCNARAVGERRRGWQVLSVTLFVLSLLTYPVVLLGGLVYVALDVTVLRRLPDAAGAWWSGGALRVWWEKVPYFVASGLAVILTVATRNVGLERSYVETLELFDMPHRVMQGFFGWAYFLWKPWWPLDLAPKYGNLISFSPWAGVYVGSAVLVLGVSAFMVWGAGRGRWRWAKEAGCWWGLHLALFLPLIGLTEHPHSLYDRYTYAPGVLWALAVGAMVWGAWPRRVWRQGLGAGLVLVLAWFVWLSREQMGVWRNTATVRARVAESLGEPLFRAEHEQRAGLYFLARGEFESARKFLEKAARHDGEDMDTRIYLGDALAGLGRGEEALIHYEAVVRRQPEDLITLHNVGVAFCKMGRFEEGADVFREILRREPAHENARHNLSLALEEMSRAKAAKPVGHWPSTEQ